MSAREQLQADLVELLTELELDTAPYGIIEGMETLPRGGKVRTVTFGVSAYLDATAHIWTPTRIAFKGQGPLAQRLPAEVNSLEEFRKAWQDWD